MAHVATPELASNPLRSRLAAVRRRLFLVVGLRGVCAVAAVLAATVVVAGLIDWRFHLPSLIRALFLVGGLTGAGCLVLRLLLRPLAGRTDDLSLALKVEELYPSLNDSLASTVEFLEHSSEAASPVLRKEAVRRAMAQASDCNFHRIIDARGLRSALLSALAAIGAAGGLWYLFPETAPTALARIAVPFSGLEWPLETQLEITNNRFRIGKNEPYEIRATVRGMVPEKATVTLRFEGSPPEEYTLDVERDANGVGVIRAKLERGRVQRNFSFRVKANDALSPLYNVSVVPPPALVMLDGRASPQLHLEFPKYTGLEPLDRPDGAGDLHAIYGTRVLFRAATDRPLARAWIEFQADLEHNDLFSFMASLTQKVPAKLDAARTVLTAEFMPTVRGSYALHIEDESGLETVRWFDLLIEPDPAPVIDLQRPSPAKESLRMLADADLIVKVEALDPLFAVRNVWLEYRTRKIDSPRRMPLANAAVDRRVQVEVEKKLSLKQFRHPDGKPLEVGDVLTVQACADDYDDVTPSKQPGRSTEVEIVIIDRTALEVLVNQEQAKLQQNLVGLREQERDALKKVNKALAELDRKGKLDNETLDLITQAEQTQQQVKERIGNLEEGLRADVARIRETLKNNNLQSSGMRERVDEVAAELKRLAEAELPEIEPRLTNARKVPETTPDPSQAGKKAADELNDARVRQQEVERTLDALLSRLEPWSTTLETRGEAKSILSEQKQVLRDTEARSTKNVGEDVNKLPKPEQEELTRLKNQQEELETRLNDLLKKMTRQSKEKALTDPEIAKGLDRAREQANAGGLAGKLKEAKEQIGQNQLGKAAETQRDAIEELEKLVKALEDRREAELDGLRKKFKEIEEQLTKLQKEQDQLQKKIKEEAANPNAKEREEALKRLARRQQELQQQAEQIQQQLKQMSRLRADQASQALAQAQAQMEDALKRLTRGEAPDDKQQEEALDRLDDARREAEQARKDAEEELAREQMAKMADIIRGIAERQQGFIQEAERIRDEVKRQKGWTRGLGISVRTLGENQKFLGDETKTLATEKLAGAAVFVRQLQKAAEAMEQAAERFKTQYQRATETTDEPGDNPEALRLQQEALLRLQQLVDALKQEQGQSMRRQQPPQEPMEGQPMEGGPRAPGDGIPDLVQLKLLRAMQMEVNKQTEAFNKKHPDVDKLTPAERTELQGLRRQQQEIADLLEELVQPVAGEKVEK